jgi:hypothetical protein
MSDATLQTCEALTVRSMVSQAPVAVGPATSLSEVVQLTRLQNIGAVIIAQAAAPATGSGDIQLCVGRRPSVPFRRGGCAYSHAWMSRTYQVCRTIVETTPIHVIFRLSDISAHGLPFLAVNPKPQGAKS